jgi:energy-coupling factor transporter ATP-binding protein EcfA2
LTQNPYKYTGPLVPAKDKKDKKVCIDRRELKKVIEEVKEGTYWAIIGPRQMGKTTFLHQLAKNFPGTYHAIYITLELSPIKEENFYEWLKEKILEKGELETVETTGKWKNDEEPHMKFLYFLKNLKIKNKKTRTKIVLLFDEIEGALHIKNFLHLWRTVYHERIESDELEKYAVIIAGSSTLFEFTVKPKSPYNIAKHFFLNELANDEVEMLTKAFNQYHISIDPKTKKKLLKEISGHPQLLQHACHLLFDTAANREDKTLYKADIKKALKKLFEENSNLSHLRTDVKNNIELKSVLIDILKGEKMNFQTYQEFSLAGVGPIVEQNKFCAIRNNLYRKFLRDLLLQNKSKQLVIGFFAIAAVIIGIISLTRDSQAGIIAAAILALTALISVLSGR